MPTPLRSPRSAALLVALLICATGPGASPRAGADEVDQARGQVEQLEKEVGRVRQQYDALVSQVEEARTNVEVKQGEIVSTTLELARRQAIYLDKKRAFETRVRDAYKRGPYDAVEALLGSNDLGAYWVASRYVGGRLQVDREVLEEMKAEQQALATLAGELEADRDALAQQAEKLAEVLDQTQQLLADSQLSLAASQEELRIKEEMKRALDLINSSGGGRRPVSPRHRQATEDQAKILATYPFGPVSGIPAGLRSTGESFEGIASWYGPGFNGLPTSSGAIYDENLYTTAHKELPFGTILLVTYRDSSVLVLVNDRGPFVAGRVLDLSRAAKDAIGMGGLGYVHAEILEPL